jgi:hypothetical protein
MQTGGLGPATSDGEDEAAPNASSLPMAVQQQPQAAAPDNPSSSSGGNLSVSSVDSELGNISVDEAVLLDFAIKQRESAIDLYERAAGSGYELHRAKAHREHVQYKHKVKTKRAADQAKIRSLQQRVQQLQQQLGQEQHLRSEAVGQLDVVGGVIVSAADAVARRDPRQLAEAAAVANAAAHAAAGQTDVWQQFTNAAIKMRAAAQTGQPSPTLQEFAAAASEAAAAAAAQSAGPVSGPPAVTSVEPLLLPAQQQPDRLARALQHSAQVAMDASAAALARGTISASVQPAIVSAASALPPIHKPSVHQQLAQLTSLQVITAHNLLQVVSWTISTDTAAVSPGISCQVMCH